MEALVGRRIRPLQALSPDMAEDEFGRRLTEQSLASNDGLHSLNRVLDSVRKYRRLVVRTIVVGALLAGVAGFLMSPSYIATAQLAVDVRQSGAADALNAGGASAAPTPAAEESTIDTHVTVLLSDAYLRRLLPTLRALEDARHGAETGSRTWMQSLRTLFRRTWSATKELLLGKNHEPDDGSALAALKRSLRVGQERRSRIIAVTSTASDPQRAAEIANTVAQSYVDEVARQKQSDVEYALSSLATQSSKVQRDLVKAEEELKASRLGKPSRDAALEWQVTTLAQQFETLLRRRQELIAKGLTAQSDVGLLATATPPERPTSLHPLLMVPPAAIIFALLACVLAVILNHFDRTLHTEADATEALRIPCAGLIPAIPLESGKQPHYVLEQPASLYARAIRSILVSILATDPATPRSQRVVLVSSSIGGEGKTTLAWSLGLYAARLGWRTLLLDFGQFARRPGSESANLLSVLAYGRPLADAIEHIHESGIDYLPATSLGGHRLRILADPKIPSLLRQLSDTYDFVIIDGPSLLEAPEARLLASWADHVLLAIRSGSTDREAAQTALRQLVRTEHLNPAQNTRFSSVFTRVESPQQDQFGERTQQLFKRTWGALRRRSKRAITWRMWGGDAIELKRSGSPKLNPRNWLRSD
ncbi:AAA family ATPase [Tardiphaga sp. 367_B4_N1_1]|uniref:AAA family ATPase n=1 Tax=Tardiphaga sp. 367_B4_N1_1 TaxID=3240777 RepID=UPI003F2244B6